MPDIPTPWVGLAALLAMFVLPFVPDWLLRGRGRSGTARAGMSAATATPPWTEGHICSPEASEAEPPLRGELRRLAPPAELERRPGARISR